MKLVWSGLLFLIAAVLSAGPVLVFPSEAEVEFVEIVGENNTYRFDVGDEDLAGLYLAEMPPGEYAIRVKLWRWNDIHLGSAGERVDFYEGDQWSFNWNYRRGEVEAWLIEEAVEDSSEFEDSVFVVSKGGSIYLYSEVPRVPTDRLADLTFSKSSFPRRFHPGSYYVSYQGWGTNHVMLEGANDRPLLRDFSTSMEVHIFNRTAEEFRVEPVRWLEPFLVE